MRILVVEDEQKVVNALREGLQGERYDVVKDTKKISIFVCVTLGLPGLSGVGCSGVSAGHHRQSRRRRAPAN